MMPPTLDREARDEAAWTLCVDLWGEDVGQAEPPGMEAARLHADLAIDCYLGRLMAGDDQIERAVRAARETFVPNGYASRSRIVDALEAAAPYFLAWALKHAPELLDRAVDARVAAAQGLGRREVVGG